VSQPLIKGLIPTYTWIESQILKNNK
jgi:hypothetical protein